MILVVGLTGAILVFAEPLNRSLHPELWRVEVGAQRVSPDIALSVARSAYAERSAIAVNLPQTETEPYSVRFPSGVLVYVDPYRGEILRVHQEKRSFTGVVEGLHTTLLMGKVGLWAVVGSTVVLLGLLLTGYVLWWPRTKTESKRSFAVEWRGGWKRFVYDCHNVFGFYASGYLILIALTGLLLSFPIFTRAVYRLSGDERPPEQPRSEVAADGAMPVSLSTATQVAETALVGWETVSVTVPARSRQAIRVVLRQAGQRPRGQRAAFVDQYSGALLRIDRPEDLSATARALSLTFPIHGGAVWGLPTMIAAFVASLVGAILPLTGFLIWYPRWTAKRRRAEGPS